MAQPRAVPADEWWEMRRNQQEQATIASRLQFELQKHLEDEGQQAAIVERYLTNPKTGAVVKIDQVDVRLKDAEAHLTRVALQASNVPNLQARLKAMEDARTAEAQAKKETRRWAWRDLIAPALAALFGAVAAGLIMAAVLGQ